MKKMQFVYCNNNPYYINTGDCAIRAIAGLEDISWDEALKRLTKISLEIKDVPITTRVLKTYLTRKNYKITPVDIPFSKFSKRDDCGKYFLFMQENKSCCHVVYCNGSKYYDSDPFEGSDWKVYAIATPIVQ